MDIVKQQKFKDDFHAFSGLVLDECVTNLQPAQLKAEAFINMTEESVFIVIERYNTNFNRDRISENHRTVIDRAMLHQALYVIYAGDYSLISGHDAINNALLNKAELQKRAFSDKAFSILKNSGLLYRGIYGTGGSPYFRERGGWR